MGKRGRCCSFQCSWCCPVSLSVLLSTVFSLVMAALCTGIYVACYTENSSTRDVLYAQNVYQQQVRLSELMDSLTDSVIQPARSVRIYDSEFARCKLTMNGKNPGALVRIFDAHSESEGSLSRFAIESVGVVMRKPGASQDSTDAYSWEISLHPSCRDFVYSHSDDTNWPKMYGWCGNDSLPDRILGPLVFSIDGPKLEPLEQAIYANPMKYASGAFLPIARSWVSNKTFTIIGVVPHMCEPNVTYAISYTEKSLSQLDDLVHYSAMASEDEYDGSFVFIVEVPTARLVACSIPDQTISADGNRTLLLEAPDRGLQIVGQFLMDYSGGVGLKYYKYFMSMRTAGEDGYLVYTFRVTKNGGLDCLVVHAVPYAIVFKDLDEKASVSVVVFIVLVILGVIFICAMIHFCVSRPIAHIINRGDNKQHVSRWFYWISEVQIVQNSVNKNGAPPRRKKNKEDDSGGVLLSSTSPSSSGAALDGEIELALADRGEKHDD